VRPFRSPASTFQWFRSLLVALAAALVLAPATLAHDEVTGTPAVTIRIEASGVSDPTVTVAPGEIVAFVNRDGERHRMRSRAEPGEFDTGDLEPGERALVRFASSGSVGYVDERDGGAPFSGRIVVRNGASSSGSGGGAGSSSTGGAGSTPSTAPGTATVRIVDRAFSPAAVTVAAGGTVTWRNADDREHTATSTGRGGIDSPVLGSGQAYRRSFDSPGTYAFLCAIHPEMRGTVKVVATDGGGSGGTTGGPASDSASKPHPAMTPTPAAASDAAPSGGGSSVSPTPEPLDAIDDAAVAPSPTGFATPSVASVGDPIDPSGLAIVAIVIAVNVAAFTLFFRTIGGVARRSD
jgi:plastocyanin